VKKQELAQLVHDYGDAIITYRSAHSKKTKVQCLYFRLHDSLHSEKEESDKGNRRYTSILLLGHGLISTTKTCKCV
jgi:hypothetical protein